RAVQPNIDEVGGHLFGRWKFAGRIGDDQGTAKRSKQVVELRCEERHMTDFKCVAVAYARGSLEQRAALQACVVAPGQALRVRGPARQEPQKGFHSLGIKAERGRKLPEKRSGLSAQRENAARIEVGQGG